MDDRPWEAGRLIRQRSEYDQKGEAWGLAQARVRTAWWVGADGWAWVLGVAATGVSAFSLT